MKFTYTEPLQARLLCSRSALFWCAVIKNLYYMRILGNAVSIRFPVAHIDPDQELLTQIALLLVVALIIMTIIIII